MFDFVRIEGISSANSLMVYKLCLNTGSCSQNCKSLKELSESPDMVKIVHQILLKMNQESIGQDMTCYDALKQRPRHFSFDTWSLLCEIILKGKERLAA